MPKRIFHFKTGNTECKVIGPIVLTFLKDESIRLIHWYKLGFSLKTIFVTVLALRTKKIKMGAKLGKSRGKFNNW